MEWSSPNLRATADFVTCMTSYFRLPSSFPRATSFLGMSALLLASNLSAGDMFMYGDAEGYWSVARQFATPQGFSLDGYVERLRGYTVPLLFYCVQQAAQAVHVNAITVFRILSAFIGSALFAVALPTLFSHVLNARLSLYSTALFCLLGFVYWRGHFLYSLSDFPACLLLATGALCFRDCAAHRRWRGAMAFSSGACIALSANARPVYEIALLVAIILVGWYAIRMASLRVTAIPIVAFGSGVALALLPQSAINTRQLGARDPFAHARSSPGRPNLYVQQLGWGIAIQRYETNIGRRGFPVAVMFLDDAGQEMLGQDRTRDPRTFPPLDARSYLGLVARHPLFFASAYARHLFNGLDVAYPTPYVTKIAPRSAILALLNYLVLVVGAMYTLLLVRRARLREHVWRVSLLAMFLLPAFAAVPTAVEPRFLLPLGTLVYAVVTFRLPSGNERAGLIRSRYTAPIAAIGVIVCFMLASATYSNILGSRRPYETWCVLHC
jgi:hypothetical protein